MRFLFSILPGFLHLEAESHLRRGLEVIKAVQPGRDRDQRELSLQLALAAALHANRGQAAPEVGQAYDRARQLCEQLDDAPQLFRVLLGLYRFYGPTEQGRNFVDQLLKLAQQMQDPDLLIEGHMAYGTSQMQSGNRQLRCITWTRRSSRMFQNAIARMPCVSASIPASTPYPARLGCCGFSGSPTKRWSGATELSPSHANSAMRIVSPWHCVLQRCFVSSVGNRWKRKISRKRR
jgi:hypothetical protein